MRHEVAAKGHARAAKFWDDQRDPERAGLQYEMAEYERQGAELERRWAELIDSDTGQPATRAAELVVRRTRQGAEQASGILKQLADALQRSADLAEESAKRLERAGRSADAGADRQAATRAREAAKRARSQAEAWLK